MVQWETAFGHALVLPATSLSLLQIINVLLRIVYVSTMGHFLLLFILTLYVAV